MKIADLEKQEAARRELEEARQAAEIQKAELEKTTRNGKNVPVPQANPLPRPVEQAAVELAPARKAFWNLFGSQGAAAQQPAAQAPADAAAAPQQAPAQPAANAKPAAQAATAQAPAEGGAKPAEAAAPRRRAIVAEQQPKKKPFWKFWGIDARGARESL